MKFNVQSKALSSAVNAVSKVLNSKSAMSILEKFLFEIDGEKLVVTGSDMDSTLKYTVKISNCDEKFKICIDAKYVVNLMKELPDVGVDFDINTTTYEVAISYTGGNYTLVGMSGEDYPNTMDVGETVERISMTLPSDVVLSGIENTIFAVSAETVRPQMTGILWDFHYSDLTFVASDTHKLVRFINSNVAPGKEASFIMPAKAAGILKGVIGKETEVSMVLTDKNFVFSTDNFYFSGSFIKGEFPAYNRVIPASNPYTLTVDRMQFLNAIRRMLIFIDQNNKLVKFRIKPTELIVKAEDSSYQTVGLETLRCDYTGNELVIGFSAQYLNEIFSTLTTENVIVQLADPSRPGVFTPTTNAEKCDLVVLLMPMSVNEF